MMWPATPTVLLLILFLKWNNNPEEMVERHISSNHCGSSRYCAVYWWYYHWCWRWTCCCIIIASWQCCYCCKWWLSSTDTLSLLPSSTVYEGRSSMEDMMTWHSIHSFGRQIIIQFNYHKIACNCIVPHKWKILPEILPHFNTTYYHTTRQLKHACHAYGCSGVSGILFIFYFFKSMMFQ